MPASSCSRSSAYMRERPSEAASNPAPPAPDRAARCRQRERWSPADRAARSQRPNSSIITSNVQRSPRWLQNHVLDVERRGVEAFGDRLHLGRPTNRSTACGSTQARISHGRRCGRSSAAPRHPDRAALRVRFGSLACGTSGSFACRQASKSPPAPGRGAGLAQPGRRAFAELLALLADRDRLRAVVAGRPIARSRAVRPRATNPEQPGSAAKSSSVRTSISTGACGVPTRR